MNKEKAPLTYTVGDTAFGEVLKTVQAQNPRESRDKNSGGRHRSPRKGRPMGHQAPTQSPETTTPDVEGKKDIAPAGGRTTGRAILETTGGIVLEGVKVAGVTAVVMGTGIGVYSLAKWLGAPIP